MTRIDRLAFRTVIAVAVLSLVGGVAAPSARAGDNEFGLLVHYVESHYHARRSHRFLIGFACVAVNLAKPEGVKGMKLALWENAKFTTEGMEGMNETDFPDVVRTGLREGWQPIVREWSRRNGERTVVFARPDGEDLKILVATVESSEAVVMQMRINPDRLSRCVNDWTNEDRRNYRRHENETAPDNAENKVGSSVKNGL